MSAQYQLSVGISSIKRSGLCCGFAVSRSTAGCAGVPGTVSPPCLQCCSWKSLTLRGSCLCCSWQLFQLRNWLVNAPSNISWLLPDRYTWLEIFLLPSALLLQALNFFFLYLYLQVHFWCLLKKRLPNASLLLSPSFCSPLELVVTSLKTDQDWWSGAGGWRMLWGKSFSSKPMRWSSISKNWATFKLIHSWRSIWHLCWWRCWNELSYFTIFHCPF